jgi:cytidylate kinase
MAAEKTDSRKMKIAVSGKSGCGNTTVSRLVAEKLGLKFINFTFRSLAAEQNISLEEVLKKAAEDDWWDKEVDRRQIEMARESGGCVLGSRLAVWMLKDADVKVYLRASPETRAERIARREGGLLEEVSAFTKERDRQDHERYLRIYTINNDDYSFVDKIINTDHKDIGEIAELILDAVSKRN